MCYYNVKALISQKYKTKLVSTRRVILGVLKNTLFSSILSITPKYLIFEKRLNTRRVST